MKQLKSAPGLVLVLAGTFSIPALGQPLPPYHTLQKSPTVSEQMTWNASVPVMTYAFVNGPNDKTLVESSNPPDTFQIALTNTAKIDQLYVQLTPAGTAMPTIRTQCLMSSVSLRIEAHYAGAGDQYVPIYNGDTNGRWSTGSGEFPHPACLISLTPSIPAAKLVSLGKVNQMPDAVRIMARAGHVTKFVAPPNKAPYIVDVASVEVKGSIKPPASGKTVNLSDMVKPKVDKAHMKDPVAFSDTMTIAGFNATGGLIKADYSYSYDLCQPKDTTEYCRLPAGNPGGSSVYPWCSGPAGFQCFSAWNQVTPVQCTGSGSTTSQGDKTNITIPLSAPSCQVGQTKPCTADGSCADIRVRVTTQWNPAHASDPNKPGAGESWDRAESNYSDKEVMRAQ